MFAYKVAPYFILMSRMIGFTVYLHALVKHANGIDNTRVRNVLRPDSKTPRVRNVLRRIAGGAKRLATGFRRRAVLMTEQVNS